MAVRPWENRLLDSNTKETMPLCDDKQDMETKSQITPKGKVQVSSALSNGSNKKKGINHKKSYSDVTCASFGRSPNIPSTSLGSCKQKSKLSDEALEEVSSQPTDLASLSTCQPKAKLVQANTPVKKWLSLPTNGKHNIDNLYIFFFLGFVVVLLLAIIQKSVGHYLEPFSPKETIYCRLASSVCCESFFFSLNIFIPLI